MNQKVLDALLDARNRMIDLSYKGYDVSGLIVDLYLNSIDVDQMVADILNQHKDDYIVRYVALNPATQNWTRLFRYLPKSYIESDPPDNGELREILFGLNMEHLEYIIEEVKQIKDFFPE